MRQASWEEIFRQKSEEAPAPARRQVSLRISFFSWEEAVTLLIVFVAFLTVVRSIDSADWVPEMPSLYEIGLLGLAVGLVTARVRVPAFVGHVFAIALGSLGVLYVSGTKLPGSVEERSWEILDRLAVWGDALVSGGISNDNIPFVVLVVSATYLTAYLAALSIFRWYNAWLGLVPGGLALLTNISYLPGQKSLPLLIYLFCAILLVARVNLLRNARDWRRSHIRYPEYISLSVLNVTVWVAIALLAVAWVLPVGGGSGAFYSLWSGVTSPVAEPLRDLGRVFSAIDSKKGGTIHHFGSTLPLQGEISLGGGDVMQVTTSETGFLRAQVYDVYTAQGWKVGPSSQITSTSWPALQPLQSAQEAVRQLRRQVSIQVTTSKRSNVIVSAGQPLAVNIDSRVVFGPGPGDVTSVRPTRQLGEEEQYRVDSTVSNASVNALRSASTAYPAWTQAYLQLPANLPQSIVSKAREVTVGAATAYDKAAMIEQFLRTFAVDTKIQAAPPKQDSVEYFLFDARRGYFDYHASAMVVMLRTLGIPARIAVGYVIHPEDRVPQTSVYEIDEGDAFAWPEVFFPGLGWVEFNPTPSEPPVIRAGLDGDFLPGFDPNQPFFDDALIDPAGLGQTGPAGEALDQLVIEEESNTVSRVIMTIVLAVIALTLAGGGILRYSWTRGLAGMPYAVQVWEKTLRLARWTSFKPLPQETPREIAARLKGELPEVDDLDYLGETYVRSRYGAKALSDEERERLESVWRKVRNNLMQRLLRWR